MPTLYRTRRCDDEIESINVVKVTKKTATISNGQREFLVTEWQQYHVSEHAAEDYLLNRATTKVNRLKDSLSDAERDLEILNRKIEKRRKGENHA